MALQNVQKTWWQNTWIPGLAVRDLGQIICKMRPLIPLRNVCESTLLTVRAYANWCRFPEMAPHLFLPGIRSSRIWKIDKPRKKSQV